MKFLINWTINLEKVPAYVEFNNDFEEKIDTALADIILESQDERISSESREEFRRLVQRINRHTQTLYVKYSPRKGKLGRRYADTPTENYPDGRPNPAFKKYWSALITMPRIIKNTLYHYAGWIDFDQVKGHITILYELATRNGKPLPSYEDYLKEGRFDEIVKQLSEFYSGDPENPLTKKDIKWLFNKTIYGGGIKEWIKEIQNGKFKDVNGKIVEVRSPKEIQNGNVKHSIYERFYNETKSIINLVYESNDDLVVVVCDDIPNTEENLWKRKNRTMSYFCGIIENEITFQAYKYAHKNQLCKQRKVSWGYDGFTIPPPPPYTDISFHIEQMNAYVKQKTGLKNVQFIRKEFEPDEILQDCIEQRRQIPDAVVSAESVILAEDVASANNEPSSSGNDEDDEEYLVWKENFEQDWCKIKNIAIFIRTFVDENGHFDKYVFQTKSKLKEAYEHEYYEKEIKGKTKRVYYIYVWTTDKNIRCYDDADVYPPPLVCPPNKFNLWRPSPYESIDISENIEEEEGVDMFKKHIRILCNHQEEVFEYVFKWICHMIQKPSVKPECMITFISEEGIGKNILTNTLSKLLGNKKKLETTQPERDVWGNHNSMMASSYLVVLSETDKRNSSSHYNKIKGLVTDNSLPVNPKGKDQFEIESYHRFIMNTNNADPIKTHERDRRNLIIRCSDEMIGETEYFTTLSSRLSDESVLKSIYKVLATTDISEWNFRQRPITDYHKTIIEGNQSPISIFMETFTYNHIDRDYVEYYGTELLDLFKTWKESTNYAFDEKISEGKLVLKLQTELKLPKAAMEKVKRDGKGIKRKYNITLLKKHFNITAGSCALNLPHSNDDDDIKSVETENEEYDEKF